MNRFLRDIWELWHGALFHPAKLKTRLADSPAFNAEDAPTAFSLAKASGRTLTQYLLTSFLLTLPLVLTIVINGMSASLVLIPVTILGSYVIGRVFFPLGFHIPIIVFLIWITASAFPHTFIADAIAPLPSMKRYASYGFVGAFGLAITIYVGRLFSEVDRVAPEVRRNLFRKIFFGVVTTVIGLAVAWLTLWIDNRTWSFTILISPVVLVFLVTSLVYSYRSRTTIDSVVWMSSFEAGLFALSTTAIFLWEVASVPTLIVTSTIAFLITIVSFASLLHSALPKAAFRQIQPTYTLRFVTVRRYVIRGVACYLAVLAGGVLAFLIALTISATALATEFVSLPTYLLTCWVISFSVSSLSPGWRPFGLLSLLLIFCGVLRFGEFAVFALPVIFLGYFRVIPDYLLFVLYSLWWYRKTAGANANYSQNYLRLPPFSSQLVWLPIVFHDLILAASFRQNHVVGIEVLQAVWDSRVGSLRHTLGKVIPQLVVEQLTSVVAVSDLIPVATQQHSFIPRLVSFSKSDWNDVLLGELRRLWASRSISNDLEILLPKMQVVAGNIQAALKAGDASLRERRLVKCLDELRELTSELPQLLPPQDLKIWQQPLSKWDAILHAEIDKQQAEAFREVVNPFHYGGPLRQEQIHLFKGRKRFADEIVRQLFERNQSTLAVYGPRRCGKTSFLFNLPRLISSDVVPVYLSAQTQGTVNSDADFCLAFIKAIDLGLKRSGVKTPSLPSNFHTRPFPLLEDWLSQSLPGLEQKQILISIDEFEKLGRALAKKRLSYRLFDELRDLFQRHEQINLLFAGVETLDELGLDWSSYFISLRPIEMVYLELDEAKQLLTDPHPSFDLTYGDGVVDDLIQLTRGHPYLLQLLGESLVKQANKYHTRRITRELVNVAIDSALTSGIAYFHYFWNECAGATMKEREIGRQVLLEMVHRSGIEYPSEKARRTALRRLKRYHVIEERNGAYRFEIPLVERWVRQRADI